MDNVLNFVIVGHVDHGKSTLIGRLLYDTDSLQPDKIAEMEKMSKSRGRDENEFAYLLDHLEEERKQGVTIDTTQVFFSTDQRHYVIIDAPGHVEFVKNMITGASQAEAAVLIVDAAEGVMEQTKRHSYMLNMLGLEQIITVINKMDLVEYSQERFEQVRSDVQEFLASIGASSDITIPIAAAKGDNIAKPSDNMPWHKGLTFLESLDSLKGRIPAEDKSLIFPVQDVYKVDEKRINAGRVEAGCVEQGEAVKVIPSGQKTKVQSVEKFLEETDRACAGESIGLTTEDALFLDRGDIVCREGGEPALADCFRARIFWMTKRPLDTSERLFIRCATQQTRCSIDTIEKRIDSSTLKVLEENGTRLENLEVGEVVIKTKKEIAFDDFNNTQEMGRFVLVKDENIVAGGIITGR
ncbi:Sulfate adenylyltransferase subunit 1 [Sedimentisphaera cyanobacteriorum]|uniref:sulfate adenylyltransferase n=1 Tax=Sedimentisphaera cyanobacteriorum TaxID=1940790 RepID=A0A1Q2HLS7_9BACT|nr:GTP-binding protein [Sedimentisphaera cyanobacteriorum]AQQ08447.1 Sulfate adenylyltransferase subunit 1 [Sedimentisphaera cyanobacteriorum]